MCKLKILVVEDDKKQQQIFSDSVEVYKNKHNCKIEFLFTDSLKLAKEKIDGSFDGVIMDLKLKDEEDGGNQIAEDMHKSFFRVPIIFVTGFPGLVNNDNPLIIKSRSREAETYEDDLDMFFEIYKTGLTKIMGGRGKIEQTLNEVFLKNLLPQLKAWKDYGKSDPSRTEKALLRFTLNHLVQILDDDEDQCFPEEVYIYPPLSDGLKTGSVMKSKDDESLFIVLNPACDLVIRQGGGINTDRILIVKIDEEQKVYGHILKKLKSTEDKEKKINTILSNRHTLYYHWLPKTSLFPGGFINFRKLSTLSKKECQKQFNEPYIQISPHFVKDILSRFSTYYARQGQPDIERNAIIEKIVASSGYPE